MRISQSGLDAIKRHEGLRLHAYPDPATGGEPWTIGYGRAHGITQGQQISAETAEQYLREDVEWVEDAIRETVTAPLTQAQFDALCSLIYNIGEGAWRKSTMLKKINAKNYLGAAQEFVRWNLAAGKVMPGLTNRRVLEQRMFESEGLPGDDVIRNEPKVNTSPEPVEKQPKTIHIPPRPDQEPYTSPEASMPIPAIVTALLPTLIESIPKLASIFKPGSQVAERNVAAASAVLGIVQSATGAVNAQEAVERIKADPAALAAATKAVEAHWFELAESGGGGIEGARKADAVVSGGDMLHSPSFWVALALLPLVYLIVGSVVGLFGSPWSDDVRSAIANGVVGMVIGALAGYYFGQTTSRNRTPAV